MTVTLQPAALAGLARELMVRSGADPGPLLLTRLRVKPGRGVTAQLRTPGGSSLWLIVDGRGARVHRMNCDPDLPGLAGAAGPEPGGDVWAALESAVRQLGLGTRIAHAAAVPVRYKPGSRCVLRYRVDVEGGGSVALYGKLYADPSRAIAIDAVMRRLFWDQVVGGGAPVIPAPLGVAERTGLALTAAAGRSPGARVLRPGPGGGHDIPAEELTAAAEALARLHASPVAFGEVRTAGAEAARMRARAAEVAAYTPTRGAQLLALVEPVAARLAATPVAAPVLSHGAYKPAQLVYAAAGRVAITDLDGLCMADAALDVGYLLAYLRPAAWWRGSVQAATWHAFAAATFTGAYARAMCRHGVAAAAVEETLRRAPLHEAAALLKIAGRRGHRLNAPREREVDVMLEEIGTCLAPATRAA